MNTLSARSLRIVGCFLLLALCAGCSGSGELWRDQRLPSGKTVKISHFMLAWGGEHGERRPAQDAFSLAFVSASPTADLKVRDQEVLEVFELMRPVSEQWGFSTASMYAFSSVDHKGPYDVITFTRSPAGSWSFSRMVARAN